ncbi:alpha,alpha-trehalose-phosphate synthase [UDP-forming] 1-like protein, partial [Tanacetum coccineum]
VNSESSKQRNQRNDEVCQDSRHILMKYKSLGRSYSVLDDIDEDDLLGDVALITCIITCLRDEINLKNEEFVGCQALKKGVFTISEFVGATQSLSAGAPLVNPWNAAEVGSSIFYAQNMPSDEREK